MSSFTVRVGGVWLHQITPYGEVKFSHAKHGPLAASWKMALRQGDLHPALMPGVTVEIFWCGARVWRGVLEEPNRDTWECTAIGFHDHFKSIAALQWQKHGVNWEPTDLALGFLNAYDTARWANGNAPYENPPGIVRDFDFDVDGTAPGGPSQLDGSPFPVDGRLTLRDTLDVWMRWSGKRWVVDHNGLLHVPPAPTEPTVALTPDVPGVGLTLENYYSATYVKYLHHFESDGGVQVPIYAVAYATSPDAERWGPRERSLYLDNDGKQVSEAAAQQIADALQAEAVAAPTESVEVVDGQVMNMHGTPIPLPLLKANTIVRHFGVLDVQGARDVHTRTVDNVEYDTTTGVATLTPRYRAARTFEQVIGDFIRKPSTDPFTFDSAAS